MKNAESATLASEDLSAATARTSCTAEGPPGSANDPLLNELRTPPWRLRGDKSALLDPPNDG
jgi:hypothetical protein